MEKNAEFPIPFMFTGKSLKSVRLSPNETIAVTADGEGKVKGKDEKGNIVIGKSFEKNGKEDWNLIHQPPLFSDLDTLIEAKKYKKELNEP